MTKIMEDYGSLMNSNEFYHGVSDEWELNGGVLTHVHHSAQFTHLFGAQLLLVLVHLLSFVVSGGC